MRGMSQTTTEPRREPYQPAYHKPVPLGTRVRTRENYCPGKQYVGRVAGIAGIHFLFNYIIILDEPYEDEYGRHEAITVPGTGLEGLDGTNWLLLS